MSTPAQTAESPKKSGTATKIIGALALLSGVLAVLLIVLGVVGLARVATPNMQGFNAGAIVTITDSGASIYARSDADRTSTVCAATKDSTSTTLERPTDTFSVDVSQSEFFEVARTPDSLSAGSYSMTCEGTMAALYVGPSAPSTSASGFLGAGSLVTGVVFAVIALGLGILATILRTSNGTKKTAVASSGYGGAQPGYSSPYASPPPPASMPQQDYSYDAYGQQGQSDAYGQPQGQSDAYGQPQGQQGGYGQLSGTQSYAPPPPPSWQSRESQETQAIPCGQGRFDQSNTPEQTPDDQRDADQQSSDQNDNIQDGNTSAHHRGDGEGDSQPPSSFSPPPPPA